MPIKMTGREFVNIVCGILGLTASTIRAVKITADCRAGVMVEVEQFATVEEGNAIAQAVSAGIHNDTIAAPVFIAKE